MAAPKFGTLVPNRIFVGGISASTSEAELTQLFSAYGNVKATKIISDRAGVSKGYGFVTFETDEEARRLQQESECIILRERKLNIAPAIKKQPFNRLFDGASDLPSTVPNNAYYYTNGLGLTYQGGLTFYNTGAAAPGTPIATPTDSTTIYQTAGIFGPQATSGHQPLSPIMYSCPTPSLYMPQQFPYPPVTYEPYYAAVAGGGPSPYSLYPTPNNSTNSHDQQQSQQGQSNGCVSGNNGGSNTGIGGGSATSTSSPLNLGSSLPPSNHFYTHSAPIPPSRHLHHHHHPPMASNSLPPPPQMDNIYYSLAAPGPPQIPPPQSQHQTIGDQQLLLYTTDPSSCQHLVSVSDNQAPGQEVQIYSSGLQIQSQYHQQQMFHQQQQLVRHRRLPGVGQAITPGRKLPGCGTQTGQASSENLRRPKVKVKVIAQGGVVCKMQDEHCLGGGGDAAGSNMVTMLPITPPATPRTRSVKIVDSVNNSINGNTKPINDACHQMQALVL